MGQALGTACCDVDKLPTFALFPTAAPKPAGAPGGTAVLPAAAGQSGRAHRGEEPAGLCCHQHVLAVRDRAEHGGRGTGAGERAGAAQAGAESVFLFNTGLHLQRPVATGCSSGPPTLHSHESLEQNSQKSILLILPWASEVTQSPQTLAVHASVPFTFVCLP